VHGVQIDQLVIAVGRRSGALYESNEIVRLSDSLGLRCLSLENVLGLEEVRRRQTSAATDDNAILAAQQPSLPLYWRIKRAFDFVLAATMILILSPVFVFVGCAIYVNMGSPVFFWQQRIGRWGAPLYVYKFRTLLAPFDRKGNRIMDSQRETAFGRFVRRCRLDELPQLWNILNGEMSFIGPRPLLPVDHPEDDSLRQMVPPGITGWAQVTGGRLVSNVEKGLLDDWYVRHASFWLDVRIVVRTFVMVVMGDARDERAIAAALVDGKALDEAKSR
jgi:lipopolysaccharide/colanic/teichoic acid biosynthesis glycosyltransferase